MDPLTRRGALGLGIALAAGGAARPDREDAGLRAIGLGFGGRLAVCALDTGSGRRLGLAAGERFAMCSTFKLALAGAVLREADHGRLRLDGPVRFAAGDLLDYAPVVRAHAAAGVLTVAQLCEAAVTVSDNSAANLLLPLIGGPAGFTRFCRMLGDRTTRLDRTEPTLNENLPGDPRDTTTPAAMVGLMRAMLLTPALSPHARTQLAAWMVATSTGMHRLRAGLPAGWRVGDKTGTGGRGSTNDLAIAWPPGRAPILIACYLDGGEADLARREAVHAAVAGVVAGHFG